jgi:rRNA maturation endonuclease Nob1
MLTGVPHLASALQVSEHQKKEVAEAAAEAARWEAAAHARVSAAEATLRRAQYALDAQAAVATRNQDAAVQLQELTMAVKFEMAANRERVKRLRAIDEVCCLSVGAACECALQLAWDATGCLACSCART